MKTLGDLGVLGEKKQHIAILSNKDLIFTGKLTEHRTIKDWIKYGYNSAIDEMSKIPLKDILSKIEWNATIKIEDIIHMLIESYGCDEWSTPIRNLKTLIKELPNMVKRGE